MSAAIRTSMSFDEFLAWEREQELRFEFDGIGPVAMTGGTIAHTVIVTSLTTALSERLWGRRCRALGGGNLKIIVNGRVRYPDAVITCSPVVLTSDIVPDPVIVFEILSPGTGSTDRIAKNHEYRATPSIRRYVMLEQAQAGATVFARDGTDWIGHVLAADAMLDLPEVAIAVPLADIYAALDLPDATPPLPPA